MADTHTQTVIGGEPVRTPRDIFKELLLEHSQVHPDLSAGEIAIQVTRRLMDEDQAFIEQFFIDEGRVILAYDLRSEYIGTRRGIFRVLDLSKDGLPAYEHFTPEKRDTVFKQMQDWREFDPISQQAKLLLSFNKPMLQASALYDTDRVLHHGQKALWKQALADGLPDDETTVEDYYSPEQLLRVMSDAKSTIIEDITRGNIRIKVKPMGTVSGPTALSGQAHGRHPQRPQTDRGVATE